MSPVTLMPPPLQAAGCWPLFCCILSDVDLSTVGLRNAGNDNHLYSNYFPSITRLLAAPWLPQHTQHCPTVTMSLHTLLFTLSVCCCLFSSSLSSGPHTGRKSGCFKVNKCKCIMKDGSGVINLNAMGDADGFLGRLRPVSAENLPADVELLLSFSPCQPFSQPEELSGAECSKVAACLTVRY